MEEGVRDFRKKKTTEPFNFNGVRVEDFKKGDIPTGRELPLNEKVLFLKKKKIGKVLISVSILGLEDSTTNVYDEFNLHVENRNHGDNLIVINKHLDDVKKLADNLLLQWEREI